MPQFPYQTKSKAVTAENQWTESVYLSKGGVIEVTGTIGASKVNYRRRQPNGTDWIVVTDNDGLEYDFAVSPGTYTINAGDFPGEYQAGVQTGDFSGSTDLVVQLSGN